MEGTKDSQVEEDCELQGCYDCGEFMASSLDKPNRRGNIPNTVLMEGAISCHPNFFNCKRQP